jgi:hypothetical protein
MGSLLQLAALTMLGVGEKYASSTFGCVLIIARDQLVTGQEQNQITGEKCINSCTFYMLICLLPHQATLNPPLA